MMAVMAVTRPSYQHVPYLERDSIERGRIEVRMVEEFEFQVHDYGQDSNVDANIQRLGYENKAGLAIRVTPISPPTARGYILGLSAASSACLGKTVPAPIKQ